MPPTRRSTRSQATASAVSLVSLPPPFHAERPIDLPSQTLASQPEVEEGTGKRRVKKSKPSVTSSSSEGLDSDLKIYGSTVVYTDVGRGRPYTPSATTQAAMIIGGGRATRLSPVKQRRIVNPISSTTVSTGTPALAFSQPAFNALHHSQNIHHTQHISNPVPDPVKPPPFQTTSAPSSASSPHLFIQSQPFLASPQYPPFIFVPGFSHPLQVVYGPTAVPIIMVPALPSPFPLLPLPSVPPPKRLTPEQKPVAPTITIEIPPQPTIQSAERPGHHQWSSSQRAMVLILKSMVAKGEIRMTNASITALTNVPKITIQKICQRAAERGFDKMARPIVLKDQFVDDGQRTGRKRLNTPVLQNAVIALMESADRYGREKNAAELAGDLLSMGIHVSTSTVLRALKASGFRKTKPTRKPGLDERMRAERFKFCWDHRNWSLKDWKRIIWSDETSVLLGQRRGATRVWRRPHEGFLMSCIRRRWKKYSEFMWWSCFSYDRKGPYYIWKPETKDEKASAAKEVNEINQRSEPDLRWEWELNTPMARLGLRNKPGRKPVWKFDETTGKLARKGKGGIDWYRYMDKIVRPLLIPFAKECMVDMPDTVVQEDNAPSHAHHYVDKVYKMADIQRLLWPGNSPDLNMIEPCWMWMKRETTKKGPPQTRAEAEQAWIQVWKSLTQDRIRMWIRRIIRHVREVIKLEGGNEYREGGKIVQGRYSGKGSTPFPGEEEGSGYETEQEEELRGPSAKVLSLLKSSRIRRRRNRGGVIESESESEAE